ncbi:UNVERIFIED_CONTAM: hypothetical protein GTU68_027717 [Idotea baltica]|nr:hypothetical protein [Idotea baltica]
MQFIFINIGLNAFIIKSESYHLGSFLKYFILYLFISAALTSGALLQIGGFLLLQSQIQRRHQNSLVER